MTDGLKDCPFCGGGASLQTDEFGDTNGGTVMCMTCFATGKESLVDWREAITAWNTRQPDAALVEALEGCNGIGTFNRRGDREIVLSFADHESGLKAYSALSDLIEAANATLTARAGG